jgi:hypothetical protein
LESHGPGGRVQEQGWRAMGQVVYYRNRVGEPWARWYSTGTGLESHGPCGTVQEQGWRAMGQVVYYRVLDQDSIPVHVYTYGMFDRVVDDDVITAHGQPGAQRDDVTVPQRLGTLP